MPATQRKDGTQADATQADATQADANGKATRTRTKREGPNASQKMLMQIRDALIATRDAYPIGANGAHEHVDAYLGQLATLIDTAASLDSAKQASNFEVIGMLIERGRPTAPKK